jgi:hypothetical protein
VALFHAVQLVRKKEHTGTNTFLLGKGRNPKDGKENIDFWKEPNATLARYY